MQIYQATQKGPLKIAGFIDPDDITNITVYWGPADFTLNVVYRIGDICKPTTDNGYYYQCTTAGRSAGSEPTWTQDTTTSGTVEFTAVPWDLWLMPSEAITNSAWSVSENISLTYSSHTATTTDIVINNFANTIVEFDLTNQVTKDNGEKLSRTFKYKTNQQ
jgi:hypothetical protein